MESRVIGDVLDISVVTGPATPAWPGDTPFSCGWSWELARGDSVNVSTITTSPHVGTHADAPLHVAAGWPGTDSLPLEAFSGPATVVHADGLSGPIALDALGLPPHGVAGGRLLVRTGCSVSAGSFPGHWPWIAEDALAALLDSGLRLLGVDAPSVDARDSRSLALHRGLFARGAFILENLDLRRVPPGEYFLDAFPLKLQGLDAAPVRAVLRPLTRE